MEAEIFGQLPLQTMMASGVGDSVEHQIVTARMVVDKSAVQSAGERLHLVGAVGWRGRRLGALSSAVRRRGYGRSRVALRG
ncbi:hypothetical protein [Mycolicibacterium sp. XJ1904]